MLREQLLVCLMASSLGFVACDKTTSTPAPATDGGGGGGGVDAGGGGGGADAGGGASGGTAGSCQNDGGSCTDYVGSSYTPATAQSSCTDSDEIFSASTHCTTTNAVATCRTAGAGESYAVVVYYYSASDASNAQQPCNLAGGTWTAL